MERNVQESRERLGWVGFDSLPSRESLNKTSMKIRIVRKNVGLDDRKAIERKIDRNKENGETIPGAIERWLNDGEGQGLLLTHFVYCKMLDVYAYNFKKEQWMLILDLKLV